MSRSRLCYLLCAGVLFSGPVFADETRGLAERYKSDAGIAGDPAIIFAEDFESGDLKKWDDVHGALTVSKELPHRGRQCAKSEMRRGVNTGGDAKKWFMPGYDRVYVRFYVRFSADYKYAHHFVTLMGSPRNDRWRPFGKAGLKPDGSYFSTGMEPWFAWGKNPPPGELSFYSYFMDMEVDRKMNKYWGNEYFPPGPRRGTAGSTNRFVPKLNEWQCWEFCLKANTPGKPDGEQVMWVDGREVGRFTGIQWRGDAQVKVNCLWLQQYGYDESDPTKRYWGESQAVWFDDIVVATEYVGPRKE